MKADKPEEAASRKPGPHRTQRHPDDEKTRRETDRSRTGEGSGASGGGSLGNLGGTPVTGGSPEFGPNEIRPQNPRTGEADSAPHDEQS